MAIAADAGEGAGESGAPGSRAPGPGAATGGRAGSTGAAWGERLVAIALAAYLLKIEQPKPAEGITFGEAIERYLKVKARKDSIKDDARHLKFTQRVLRGGHAIGRHHRLAHQRLEG